MKIKQRPGNEPTGGQTGTTKPEQTFTKDQVNELMRKRVERSHNAFYNRYGVKDLTELDELFGKSNSYDELKTQHDELGDRYTDLETKHKDLTKRYAYNVGNINPEKYNDIETYFKGKGIDIDEESLMEELKNHPEWANKAATIEALGSEVAPAPGVDEKEMASQIFGVTIK